MKTTTVLVHEWVTGGGLAGQDLPPSWAAEGGAMRRAVSADFTQLDGVWVVTTLDERFAAERVAGSEIVAPGREEAVLRRLAASCDFTVVIAPETGGVLESRAALVESAGGRSLGSSPAAVALAADKLRLARHWERAGVPTPRTEPWDPRGTLPSGFNFPAVLKPVDGAGSLHTDFLEGPRDRIFSEPPPGAMILQPFVPGEPMSATFLVSRTGRVRLVGVGWQDVAVVGGRFAYRGGRLPAPASWALGAPVDAVRSVPGLRGVVGVDFVRDPDTGAATVLEINPRPTTSYVGLQRLLPPGVLARAWLDACISADRDLSPMIDGDATARVRFSADGTVTEGSGAADDAPG